MFVDGFKACLSLEPVVDAPEQGSTVRYLKREAETFVWVAGRSLWEWWVPAVLAAIHLRPCATDRCFCVCVCVCFTIPMSLSGVDVLDAVRAHSASRLFGA